ncbi:MAG: ATP-binding cassette protein [Hyphomicrobiales bacterium]|nr:ATP-binding cassette protein [Hyphomicrobiales bacterium]
MTSEMIGFRDVGLAYSGGVRALDGVSASIEKGAFVALVGGSGSGKTSLLKTINRLIEPTSGDVFFDGEPVRAQDAPVLRRRIGYVFQGLGLFPHMSVAENICVTPDLLGWSKDDMAARVSELLKLVDLPQEVASRAPSALSGGQRQRVALARALAARPPVMLMDEPFGALDPVTRDGLMRACRALHDALGLTTIMVTHDMQEALLSADRILVLAHGRLVADGTPAEFLRDDAAPEVVALIDVPRRQSARIQDLMRGQGSSAHG